MKNNHTSSSTSTSSSSSPHTPLQSITHSHFIDIIHAILSCEFESHVNHLADILHITPQGHTMLTWKPQFIGYLESFDKHWQEFEKYVNLSIPYDSAHTHGSQSDPYGVKVAILELLDLKPEYLRAICRFNMVDYMCFGFKLPLICSGMLKKDGRYVPFQDIRR